MFTIGIDPHKGSHVAAVLDEREQLLGEVRVRADRRQRERLLCFAQPYTPRVWAIEGARGLGALLAQQLVAAGETVLDVPAKLSTRVRLLDNGCADKNDSHDARSAAIVGMRHRNLGVVTAETNTSVLRLLAKRHHDLTARRTQAICRLHAVLAMMSVRARSWPGSDRRTRLVTHATSRRSSSSTRSVTPTPNSRRCEPGSWLLSRPRTAQ